MSVNNKPDDTEITDVVVLAEKPNNKMNVFEWSIASIMLLAIIFSFIPDYYDYFFPEGADVGYDKMVMVYDNDNDVIRYCARAPFDVMNRQQIIDIAIKQTADKLADFKITKVAVGYCPVMYSDEYEKLNIEELKL